MFCGLIDKKTSPFEKPAEPIQTDADHKKSKIEITPVKSDPELVVSKNDNLKSTVVVSPKNEINSENNNDLSSKAAVLPEQIQNPPTTVPLNQPNKPENSQSNNTAALAIIGAWQTSPPCNNLPGTQISKKTIFTFDKVRFSYDVTVYYSPGCQLNKQHQLVESGTWSEDNGVIQFVVDSFQQSNPIPEQITIWNTRKECGHSDWELNKLVETIGVTCADRWKTRVGDSYKASYSINAGKFLLTLNGPFVDQVTGLHDSLNFIYPYELEPVVK